MKRPVPINDEAPLASAPPEPAREAAHAEGGPSIRLLLLLHLQLLLDLLAVEALVPQPLSR